MFHVEQGRMPSLSQNLTILPAPSGREPLALPETLRFSQKLSRHAKGPIPEGAVCAADWGSFGRYPLRRYAPAPPRGRQPSQSAHCVRSQLPLRGSWHRVAMTERVCRPLGEGGCDQREQTEGTISTFPPPKVKNPAEKRSRWFKKQFGCVILEAEVPAGRGNRRA